jgi:hypothetical protein
LELAKQLSFPERVTEANIQEVTLRLLFISFQSLFDFVSKMRKLVERGSEVHPGAKFINKIDGSRRYLKVGPRKKFAEELKVIASLHFFADCK